MDVMGVVGDKSNFFEFFLTFTPHFLEKLASHGAILPTLSGRWVQGVSFICFQSHQLENMPASETKGIP